MRIADMTKAKAALRVMRDAKIPATMTHIILRACALVLARNPQWHQLVCNYQVLTPGQVDIGLSLAGQTTYAPVVVIHGVDQKPLSALVPFVIDAIDAAVLKERVDLENMRRQMWLIPFGFHAPVHHPDAGQVHLVPAQAGGHLPGEHPAGGGLLRPAALLHREPPRGFGPS